MDRREYEELRRRMQAVPVRRVATLAAIGLVVLLVLIAPFTMFYTVEAAESGIVLRFGKFSDEVSPGLHWKLPFGIDTVTRVPIAEVKKEEFGFRTLAAGKRSVYDQGNPRRDRGEYNMLTGDLKMADVKWVVQYKILSPQDYLFEVRNPDATLRDVAEASMRLVVGDYSMTDVLTAKRTQIEKAVQAKIQATLDAYKAGIHVATVKLQDVNPPEDVKKSFNEVNEARQEKETTINNARKEYFKAIPSARGEAQKMIGEAQGFKAKRVNEALGDVANFQALLDEYLKSKEITRTRLYLETLKQVLPQMQQLYIVDEAQGKPLQVLDVREAAGAVRSRSTGRSRS